mmetsp:Transcript_16431/g.42437  ORF Transcript_16431/g.42437 Transcript_16431/m.42437 type:complete len:212 (-) Transcript_16431:43-678(-)
MRQSIVPSSMHQSQAGASAISPDMPMLCPSAADSSLVPLRVKTSSDGPPTMSGKRRWFMKALRALALLVWTMSLRVCASKGTTSRLRSWRVRETGLLSCSMSRSRVRRFTCRLAPWSGAGPSAAAEAGLTPGPVTSGCEGRTALVAGEPGFGLAYALRVGPISTDILLLRTLWRNRCSSLTPGDGAVSSTRAARLWAKGPHRRVCINTALG